MIAKAESLLRPVRLLLCCLFPCMQGRAGEKKDSDEVIATAMGWVMAVFEGDEMPLWGFWGFSLVRS